VPLAKGKRCFSVNGFSLHANTAINTHARDRLSKLIEYIARGPLSNERLEILANGDVKLALKTPWANGTTHLVFTPSEFIEKLVALIPPPHSHLVRWSGVFAPNSPYRKDITIRPEMRKGFQFTSDETSAEKTRTFKNYTWSKMLAVKIF
jgi:Putative transposase